MPMERKQKSSFRRLIRIAGSNRAAVPGARFVRNANPNERIQVTVSIRPQSTKELQASVDEISTRLPGDRRYLTPAEVEAFHGASQADLQKIRTFALNHGLEVSEANAQRRTVVLRGTINSLSLAFGVNLGKYRYHGV